VKINHLNKKIKWGDFSSKLALNHLSLINEQEKKQKKNKIQN
jgi:hypothetical protein